MPRGERPASQRALQRSPSKFFSCEIPFVTQGGFFRVYKINRLKLVRILCLSMEGSGKWFLPRNYMVVTLVCLAPVPAFSSHLLVRYTWSL